MNPGKMAAQVGHAVAGSFRVSTSSPDNMWHKAAHRWLIVLEADNDTHLTNIREYLQERHVNSYAIIDEGVNEIRPFSITALGVERLDKDSPEAALLSGLKKYRHDTASTSEGKLFRAETWNDAVYHMADKPWWKRLFNLGVDE